MNAEKIDTLGTGGEIAAHPDENHVFTVIVNEHRVNLLGHSAAGKHIKTAAIEQGVPIQPDFVLEEQLPGEERRIVEDHEHVHLKEHMRFIAREGERHVITITVNEQPVKLHGHKATGAEIKAAAITQGVAI